MKKPLSGPRGPLSVEELDYIIEGLNYALEELDEAIAVADLTDDDNVIGSILYAKRERVGRLQSSFLAHRASLVIDDGQVSA